MELVQLYYDAQKGLDLPSEYMQGIAMQAEVLCSIQSDFAKHVRRNRRRPDHIDFLLFRRLRDAYSLFPSNPFMWRFFRRYCRLASGDCATLLARDLRSKPLLLHVSCRMGLYSAKQSVQSFRDCGENVVNIIVIGSDIRKKQVGIGIVYRDGVLELQVPDDYESLHIKTLHAFTILALLSSPSLVIKMDDDVRLGSNAIFSEYLAFLKSKKISYAGVPCTGTPTHAMRWQGWHVGKCKNKTIERLGSQVPFPRAYADGGFTYAIGGSTLQDLGAFYLHHAALMNCRSYQCEDAAVGLALELSGVSLLPIKPSSMGIQSTRHAINVGLGAAVGEFEARIASKRDLLSSHYSHDIGYL